MNSLVLPLFPLDTVLFPGSVLTLRIFEPRYLELVRECSRHGTTFGVCLIVSGQEVGEPAIPAALGCEARIVDFSSTADGLLSITIQGERRFHVVSTDVRDNGQIMAEVRWCIETDAGALQPEHELLSVLLRRIFDRAGAPHNRVEKQKFRDPDWLSWQLAEWLPLSREEKQDLLKENAVDVRLQYLLHAIAKLQAP